MLSHFIYPFLFFITVNRWEREAEEEKKRRLREERQAEYAAYLASSNSRKKSDVPHKPTEIDPSMKEMRDAK